MHPYYKNEFADLFEEFISTYPTTPEGQEHLGFYTQGREEARRNFHEIAQAADRGDDVTDDVLLRLLPYADNATNREKGAWICIAPSITGNLRGWFESKEWVEPEQWPEIAEAILHFIRRCIDDPAQLVNACKEFSELPYKGFQSGMLSPILNALRPEDFVLINSKSLRVVNYFRGQTYTQRLLDYPAVNVAEKELLSEVADVIHEYETPEIRDNDLFDMFCHWLVAIKGYNMSPNYWKMAPGEDAWNWEACRDGEFIAMGWDALGDLSGVSYEEFDAQREAIIEENPDYTKAGTSQVWKFVEQMKESDRIVANHGTKKVLGIGMVTGPYYFVPEERHGHRRRVRWQDLRPRQVNEKGWIMTLKGLDREKFDAILNAPIVGRNLAEPFSEIFVDWQEAEWTFNFLSQILQKLGVEDADDPRFALTLRDHPPRIHLDFGNWLVFGLEAPESAHGRIRIPLFDSKVISDEYDRSGSFSQPETEEQVSLYYVSLKRLQTANSELRGAYDDVLDFIANRFGGWKASNYRKYNIDQLAEAVFDEKKREKLLDKGLDVEPIRERQIWWVNQGKNLEAERAGGFLWASLESKAGHSLYHWDTLDEVQEGDVILHYANGALRYVSQVTSEAIITENPHQESAGDREWEGRLVEVDYHELPSPLSVDNFVHDLMELDIAQGPIDSHGGIKQGYLFRFTWEGLGAIQSTNPAVGWPEFVPLPPPPPTQSIYPLETCAKETGFDQTCLERWVRAIERKKQAIIYGPPGTGKTYIAEHLAKHLIGGGDGFREIVQFHPAYAYEDFIQGLRPRAQVEGGLEYKMVPGRFLSFCRRARSRHGRCVLIIDEINRANLSRVFGELMYLLEYRDQSIPLAGGKSLSIPGNVRIIGTMNTADRSIALVDHALRRRFAFLALYPDYDILRHYHEREETGFVPEGLIHTLKTLNRRIDDRHYHVGITFFLCEHLEREIEDIWRMEIEPYLEEYFFDQPGEVESFRWEQVGDDICQS